MSGLSKEAGFRKSSVNNLQDISAELTQKIHGDFNDEPKPEILARV